MKVIVVVKTGRQDKLPEKFRQIRNHCDHLRLVLAHNQDCIYSFDRYKVQCDPCRFLPGCTQDKSPWTGAGHTCGTTECFLSMCPIASYHHPARHSCDGKWSECRGRWGHGLRKPSGHCRSYRWSSDQWEGGRVFHGRHSARWSTTLGRGLFGDRGSACSPLQNWDSSPPYRSLVGDGILDDLCTRCRGSHYRTDNIRALKLFYKFISYQFLKFIFKFSSKW